MPSTLSAQVDPHAMTIWTLFSVFNEVTNLPRAMDSVDALFPDAHHIVVDGRYPDFPGADEFSTDGTRDLAWRRGELLLCHDYECEKRTAGLRHIDTVAKDGDWVLVLDADETITEHYSWPTGKVGQFSFTRTSDGRDYGRNRLYRWEPGLHFKGRHYDCYDLHGELFATLEAPPCELVGSGIHYDESHSPVRMKDKRRYYTELRKREGSPWEAANV